MTDQSSPPAGSQGDKPKRDSFRAVPLLQFLRDKTIAAQKQLLAARRMPPPPMSPAEQTEAIDIIARSFDALLRLESLMAGLPDANSEIASQVIAVVEGYLCRLESDPAEPLRVEGGAGPEGVWKIVRAIHRGAREPETQKRRQICVRFALWLGRLKGALSEEAFIELASRAFPVSGRSKSGNPDALDLGKLLASQLHKKSSRETLLRVSEYFTRRISGLEHTIQVRDLEAERQRTDLTQTQESVARLERQLREIQQQLTERDATILALNQDISDHRAIKRHSEKQLRARMGGFLNDQLLPLVRDIHDSASIEPIRAHVIFDRTESTLNLIQKETKWLTSSD